ncbi:MAG: hypothetical protein ACOYLU_02730, partial [Limisphaerales bacterium]
MTVNARFQTLGEDAWGAPLDALAERVAGLVRGDRTPDDVADHQRGRVFPTALILRQAEEGSVRPAPGMIPWHALPETLTDLAEYLPLDDTDLAILLIASAPALDP